MQWPEVVEVETANEQDRTARAAAVNLGGNADAMFLATWNARLRAAEAAEAEAKEAEA